MFLLLQFTIWIQWTQQKETKYKVHYWDTTVLLHLPFRWCSSVGWSHYQSSSGFRRSLTLKLNIFHLLILVPFYEQSIHLIQGPTLSFLRVRVLFHESVQLLFTTFCRQLLLFIIRIPFTVLLLTVLLSLRHSLASFHQSLCFSRTQVSSKAASVQSQTQVCCEFVILNSVNILFFRTSNWLVYIVSNPSQLESVCALHANILLGRSRSRSTRCLH